MTTLLITCSVAIALSLLAEHGLARPSAPLQKRSCTPLLIHAMSLLLLIILVFILFRRPFFSAGISLGLFGLILLISNAKHCALNEPMVFSDFVMFAQTLKHPRLYLPFLGILPIVMIPPLVGLTLYAGLILELPVYSPVWATHSVFFAIFGISLFIGIVYLVKHNALSFEPVVDLEKKGLLASLVIGHFQAGRRYRAGALNQVLQESTFSNCASTGGQSDIVVIQSESFFDVRRLYALISPSVFQHYDATIAQCQYAGSLNVDAWGANTMRTEFSFLTGIPNSRLTYFRFYPYHYLQTSVPSIASHFRQQGYRTVCIHPHAATFFERDRVFPLLGFDEFIDIQSFSPNDKVGPYTSDAALTRKIFEIQTASSQPIFVFAITMENHGPFHLEEISEQDEDELYHTRPSFDSHDLTVYLRHLRNADTMVQTLTERLVETQRDCLLCFYGDHIPSFPSVYQALQFNNSQTDYFIWHNRKSTRPVNQSLNIDELPSLLVSSLF